MIPLNSLFETPVKQDRDAAFFSYTRSICPTCKKVIDAHIVLRDDRVWMQKKCPQHGYFEVEISSDAEYYVKSLSYTKPGTMPFRRGSAVGRTCPACITTTSTAPSNCANRSPVCCWIPVAN